MKVKLWIIILGIVLLAFGNAFAATKYVDVVGGSDTNGGTSLLDAYKTITHALTLTITGDAILVADGLYNSSTEFPFPLNVSGQYLKAIGNLATIEQDASLPYALLSLGANSSVEGFIIKNDHMAHQIAVSVEGNSVYIKNLTITAEGFSKAIFVSGQGVTIEGCKIYKENSNGDDYGIYFADGANAGNYNVYKNEIRGFYYGVYDRTSFSPAGVINRNTIVKNVNGINILRSPSDSQVAINNCIIASSIGGYSTTDSYGIYNIMSLTTSNYNDVYNNDTNWSALVVSGEADKSVDASFVGAASNDYHLLAGSPCIDAGTPEGTEIGAYDFISPLSVTIETPVSGEVWIVGNIYNITWESSGSPTSINLYYITSESIGYVPIATGISGGITSYAWTVPTVEGGSTTSRVSIEAIKGTDSAADVSPNYFAIENPVLIGSLQIKDRTTGSSAYTNNRTVSVEAVFSGAAAYGMIVSENSDFTGASWGAANTSFEKELTSSEGAKRLYMKARNSSFTSIESPTKEANIILDITSPEAPVLLSPANNSIITNTRPTLSWTATDEISGISSYEVKLDGTIVSTQAATTYTPLSALNYGEHTWTVRAKDNAQNWGNYAGVYLFTISSDAITPEAVIRAGGIAIKNSDYISAKPTVNVIFTDDVSLDAGSAILSIDDLPVSYTVISSLPRTLEVQYTPLVDLSSQTHVIKATINDAAGNPGTSEITGLKVSSSPVEKIGEILVSPTVFNPESDGTAKIVYTLNKDSEIIIYMFGVDGSPVAKKKIILGQAGGRAGYNEVEFNGKSDLTSTNLGDGIYIIMITAGGKEIGKGHFVVKR